MLSATVIILFTYTVITTPVGAAYTDYGTCQSVQLNAYAKQIYSDNNGQTAGLIQTYLNGTMNSDIIIESSGGPYVGYDYIEYDGAVYITGPAGYVIVNVGYTYGRQSYQLVSGSGSVVVSSVNSTAIEYYIQGVGTWEITVDSNQFPSPSWE